MPPPPLLAGRFEVHEPLGSGGMATVHRGTDRVLGRTVAIKILASRYAGDEAFVARFRREARAAARLSHPGIVSVFDTGSEDGTHYIVMEYVRGKTLAEILAAEGTLSPERAARIAEDVASALAFAHENGVVHRDVKPANVMITSTGVKVMDFGIARATTDETLTKTALVLGTATYLSPEQAEGRRVDARSDVYSLGVVLYEMLAGRPPFVADSAVAVATKHVREAPVPPSTVDRTVPGPLDAVVMKALAKDPVHRYQSAGAMRSAIESAARSALSTPVTTARVPPDETAVLPAIPAPGGRRKKVLAAGIAVLVAAAVVAVAVLAGGGSPTPPQTRPTTPPAHTSSSPPRSSPSPEPPSTSTVAGAIAALAGLISQGTASGDIDDHAAEELQHKLDDVTKELDHEPEKAAEKAADMREKLGELVEKGEISETFADQIGAAIDALQAALGGSGEED